MIGLIKTKNDFISKPIGPNLNELISLYPGASSGQINSWNSLLNDVVFNNYFRNLPNDLVVGLEYLLPIEGMGIDLFIAGANDIGKKILYIIEAKEWSDFYIAGQKFSNSRFDGDVLHPQIQVHRHYIAVKNYLSLGSQFDEIVPILYIKGCTQKGIEMVQKQCFDYESKQIPIFNRISDILSLIASNLKSSGGFTPSDFYDAVYSPSLGIIESMKSLVSKETPFVLTQSQERVVLKIKKAIKEGKKIIRIIGAGGSGKTAILLNMFVSCIANPTNYKAYFSPGAQNFKLYRSLYPEVENVFGSTYGIRNSVMHGKVNEKTILFIDEAQHNEAGLLSEFVKTGCTIIICYDDNQVINLANSAIDELKQFESREDFIGIELTESVRFSGSNVFEPNVHQFLNGRTTFDKDDKFKFKVFNSLSTIIDETIELIDKNPDSTVAIVGLLSNDADLIISKTNGKLKIDWGQPEKGIPAESRWIPYVNKKNYLSDMPLWVGTWWAPGLDFDYVVVIVGGDAKMTSKGVVAVPEQAKHFRMMQSVAEKMGIPCKGFSPKQKCDSAMAYLNQKGNEKEKEEFIKTFSDLIKDNYYIMMTRGRKGCFVYFTDSENKY